MKFYLCTLLFVASLTLPQGSAQLFRRQTARTYQRPSNCGFLLPCRTTTPGPTPQPWWETTSTTEPSYPTPDETDPFPPNPYPTEDPYPVPVPQPSAKKVNFLEIAETCAANFITQDYKPNWEDKFKDSFRFGNQWDIRLTSKLFVYLMAFNMYETNGLDISETQLETSSCFLTTTLNGFGISNTTGFSGKSVLLRMAQTNLPKVFRFAWKHGPVPVGSSMQGTASIILSDNDSYNVLEFCLDNGLRSFAMYAKGPVLRSDMEAIKLHLKAIGYNSKNFIDLDPVNNCEGLGDNGEYTPKTGKFDLPVSTLPNRQILKFFNNNNLLPIPAFFWKKK